MMKQILFFATPNDIRPIISALEAAGDIGFVRVGNHDTENPPVLSGGDLPQPGIATHETASGSISYLIVPREGRLHVGHYISEDPDTFGQKRWSVYNGFNEESVEMTLAGIWDDNTLLPGSIKTMHTSKFAQSMMRAFQAALRKQKFEKVQSWWLGQEALDMLRAGKRLSTTAVQSPPEYDLLPEHVPAELR
jgi:hypothetical protein